MKTSTRTWYVTLIAVYYFVICSLTSIYYLSQHFFAGHVLIPWSSELLCFGLTISSALYFVYPRAGHRCLIALTLLILISIGESDLRATGFHFAVLSILSLPLLLNRKQNVTESQASGLAG